MPPFRQILSLGEIVDGRRETGTRVVVEPALPILAMAVSYTARSADVSELWLWQVTQRGRPEKKIHGKSRWNFTHGG